VTFLVLLIACAVSSGLLLVKAEQRHKEIAVRLAMGASRIQIMRQLMLESFLISILAAAAGMVFALWCTDLLSGAIGNEGFTLPLDAATPLLNTRVLFATGGFAFLSALLFGLAPSLIASRSRLIPFLKNETQQMGRHRAFSVKNIFIVAQVAFSILLLVGAGLLLRTLWKTREVNPGFDTTHPVVASIDLAKQGYKKESAEIFYARLLENLRSAPGIQSAALARTVPVQESGMRITFEHNDLAADLNIITPEFFKTLKVPILRGRDFQGNDTKASLPVAIVNEELANKMWPNQDPIGKTLSDVGPDSGSVQIVGIVPDIKYRSLRDPAAPTLYLPLAQWYMPGMTIVATSKMDPLALLPQVRRVVENLDKDLPVYSSETLPQKLNVFLLQERVLAGLLTVFGTLALLLAAVGLYSLLSFVTQARTREIGVRMAVGAERKDVLRVFLNRGLALTLTGVALGILISLSATQVMKSLLFAVTPFDAWTYSAITFLMVLTSFIASYIPARRAANLDPVVALHYE
jgi:putative ABC transport system permease protein